MPAHYIQRLERFLENHLPVMVSMGASVKHYDGQRFELQAPLALNHNDKGTGFGGSLYNICVMNAIGLGFLKAFERGLDPDLVVGKAEIEYKAPVNADPIVGIALSPDDEAWETFFQRYVETGKASITLESRIYEGDTEAVYFRGRFALIGERPESFTE